MAIKTPEKHKISVLLLLSLLIYSVSAVQRGGETKPAAVTDKEGATSTEDSRDSSDNHHHHQDVDEQNESETERERYRRVMAEEEGEEEEYRREAEVERQRLLHRQQTVGQQDHQQRRETGEPAPPPPPPALLIEERQRLVREQKLSQQRQKQAENRLKLKKEMRHQGEKDEGEVEYSDREEETQQQQQQQQHLKMETSTTGQQSLYDSGREGDEGKVEHQSPDKDKGVPDMKEREPARGDDGREVVIKQVRMGKEEGERARRVSADEQDGECDTESQENCPHVKEDVYKKGMELVGRANSISKAKGYELLKEAAESGHTRAIEQVAYAHLIGSVLERNFTWSFEKFTALAEAGNPIGQQGLGFMYSTGIGVNSSQAKALLYYTFAALGGHRFAQTTMGYRSLMGISVAQSCETALYYYQKAAKQVIDEVTIVTGGLVISKVRLMEEDNEATNVYGVSEDDMINYHNVFTDSGNTGAQVLLGVYYMYGMAGAERSFKMALKFLEVAARDGFVAANALIGKIYAEGSEEVPRDYAVAFQYFKKAKDLGHADGFSGLGMMYLYGMGVEQDYSQALELFQKATDKGSAEGQYYLGHMLHEGYGTKRNLNKALRLFQLASHGGHLLAIYNLAKMHVDGQLVKRNCNYAVELFKGVSERGKWTRTMEDAERSYEAGDLDSALIVYLLLAEMGLEVAQTNAAYILEQDGVSLVQEKETLKRALILWNRSASQGYALARVKLGDYYYYGQGTDVNFEAAASQYRIASDKQSSAQAMFNLAYMYQQGYGLEKDYHLAKRYYDLAAETSGEAHVPVVMALMNLNLLYYCDLALWVMSSPTVTQTMVGRMERIAGDNWDMYLIGLLSGLLAVVFMWRWRH